MKKNTPSFIFYRDRSGISQVVTTVILIVVAIALALLAATIARTLLTQYGRQEGFHVTNEKAYYVQSASPQVCVSVTFKNIGSGPITNIAAQVISPVTQSLTVGSTTLQPGSSTSAYACFSAGSLAPGANLVVRISGTTSTGSQVSETTSIPVV